MNRDLFEDGQTIPQPQDTAGDVSVTAQRPCIPLSGGGFYNTTNLRGDELAAAVRSADHQDAAVLAIYRAAGVPLSPSEVWHRCEAAGKKWPLTSVRRSISNLTDAGALQRLETKRTGEYGRPEHEWGLAA